MFKILSFLVLTACHVSAFIPAGNTLKRGSPLKMNFEDAIGAQPPLGMYALSHLFVRSRTNRLC